MSISTQESSQILSTAEEDTVLQIEDLKTYYYTEEGVIPAVDGVTLSLERGKVLAIVGESGCGKSVMAYSILRLIQKPGKILGGRIVLHPREGEAIDITALDEKSDALYDVRGGKISMIFQEPMTALSPVHSIGNQICEAILIHQEVSKEEARKRAVEMLGKVGIPGPEERINQHPHEMSGGMRQRVVIAMALVCKPEVLIADEPTTALDVTIQAQILKLIKELQAEIGTSVIFITHDLAVVAQMADEVAVMYLGKIVEKASVRRVLKAPRHPYTSCLLESLPRMDKRKGRLPAIKGSVPSLSQIPLGCPFHPRCPYMEPGICDVGDSPELRPFQKDYEVACVRVEEIHGRNKYEG